MAHFAEINQAKEVLRVIVVSNNMLLDKHGAESEAVGISFCKSLYGSETSWVQTSYTGSARKNYAGTGFIFDSDLNAFIPPKPEGEHWLLNKQTCHWFDPAAVLIKSNIGVTRV